MPGLCLLAVTVLTTSSLLRADDKTADNSNYNVVPIKSGDNTSYIRASKETDPLRKLSAPPPDAKYDPRAIFSHSSSLSNKQFSMDSALVSKSDTPFANQKSDLMAKPFTGFSTDDNTAKFTTTKYSTKTSSDTTHSDADFAKSYSTTTSPMTQGQMSQFAVTSSDQNHTADLGPGKTNVYAASSFSKQYLGPGAQHVPQGFDVKDQVIAQAKLTDLPNRPLTIDEVRGLINHGFKPDTDSTPEAPSKALNDPDYKPETSPEPPDESKSSPSSPSSGPKPEDDKNDPLPSPGTMSQPAPENTEPLPQH